MLIPCAAAAVSTWFSAAPSAIAPCRPAFVLADAAREDHAGRCRRDRLDDIGDRTRVAELVHDLGCARSDAVHDLEVERCLTRNRGVLLVAAHERRAPVGGVLMHLDVEGHTGRELLRPQIQHGIRWHTPLEEHDCLAGAVESRLRSGVMS